MPRKPIAKISASSSKKHSKKCPRIRLSDRSGRSDRSDKKSLTNPMPVKVKICGITNSEDAEVAIQAGADALGFVFYDRSPRKVSLETAAGIVRGLKPWVVRVGVFVNAPEDLVVRAI